MSDENVAATPPEELPVVGALRALSVFSANQSGAYREHFAELAAILGPDISTALATYVASRCEQASAGLIVLTGNAGTGKTAVAEAYCRAAGAHLPDTDDPTEVAPGKWVIKDLSGLSGPSERVHALRQVIEVAGAGGQALVCANEGVIRDALEELQQPDLEHALELALRNGADRKNEITVVNANRQRPTAKALWEQLLDYITREQLWTGCRDCPLETSGCPMRSNAGALRKPDVREQLRTLVRLGSGEAVPTLREVLAILSWAIVGDLSCEQVKDDSRDKGKDAFTASSGYFTRAVGGGLTSEAIERSPLLSGIRQAGLGDVSDLEADGWLRDTAGAPRGIRVLAGDPQVHEPPLEESEGVKSGLLGSTSPLDRVNTRQRAMTFSALGEMVSTDEDLTRVEDGLQAMVASENPTVAAGQALWRQRLFFEGTADLGGPAAATKRLLEYRYMPELADLAARAASNRDTFVQLSRLVQGLNFLVTGFASATEGLIVPDPSCLFSRDPGSFRPARPSLVHSQVSTARLHLSTPDRGLVEEVLDVDHIEVELTVDNDPALVLRIRPRMYEAIREAAEYQGPVGQGVAEMNDLRSFYGRLAAAESAGDELRVADPDSTPPALVSIGLPHFENAATH